MADHWNDIAGGYMEYLHSPDGQVQAEVTDGWVMGKVGFAPAQILDAGCGGGDLAGKLAAAGFVVSAFDISSELIERARVSCPAVDSRVGNIEDVSFEYENQFDVIVCNLVLMNVQDLSVAFAKFAKWLKPSGRLLVSIVNPYYGYPVGVWKRGVWGRLLGRLPKLIIRDYFAKDNRTYEIPFGKGTVTNYRHTMPEYIEALARAGLKIQSWQDLRYIGGAKNLAAHRASEAALFVGVELVR